jgi:hypothetical protein
MRTVRERTEDIQIDLRGFQAVKREQKGSRVNGGALHNAFVIFYRKCTTNAFKVNQRQVVFVQPTVVLCTMRVT